VSAYDLQGLGPSVARSALSLSNSRPAMWAAPAQAQNPRHHSRQQFMLTSAPKAGYGCDAVWTPCRPAPCMIGALGLLCAGAPPGSGAEICLRTTPYRALHPRPARSAYGVCLFQRSDRR